MLYHREVKIIRMGLTIVSDIQSQTYCRNDAAMGGCGR